MNRHLYLFPACIIAAAPVAALSAETTLLFAFDSSRITAQHEPLLDAAVAEFRATGSSSISIVGHTDTSGTSDYNRGLSERRANAVSAALMSRGVNPGSLATAWRGQEDLAVPTGDGVREVANRRVVISLSEGTAIAPTPVVQTASVVPEEDRFRFIIAPYGAYNFEPEDKSWFAGLNMTASYDLTPNLVLSVEQAGFHTIGANDNGFGGRTAAGLDFQIDQLGGYLPYVGANVGYSYFDASPTGGLFAGPEVGLRVGGFSFKVAYDIYLTDDGISNGTDRGIGDGVLSATLGYGLRF